MESTGAEALGLVDLAVAEEGVPARVIRPWRGKGDVWLELGKEGFQPEEGVDEQGSERAGK